MTKILIITTATIALSACTTSANVDYRQKYTDITSKMAVETEKYYQSHGEKATIEMGKDAVKLDLKDPESAKFTGMKIKKYGEGRLVCGHVNAKNSYGGYVGSKAFVAAPFIAQIYAEGKPWVDEITNIPVNACFD